MSKWISVDDGFKPKDGERYLICYSCSNGKYCGQLVATHCSGRFYQNGSYSLSNVTHWQPLPEPPEAE